MLRPTLYTHTHTMLATLSLTACGRSSVRADGQMEEWRMKMSEERACGQRCSCMKNN